METGAYNLSLVHLHTHTHAHTQTHHTYTHHTCTTNKENCMTPSRHARACMEESCRLDIEYKDWSYIQVSSSVQLLMAGPHCGLQGPGVLPRSPPPSITNDWAPRVRGGPPAGPHDGRVPPPRLGLGRSSPHGLQQGQLYQGESLLLPIDEVCQVRFLKVFYLRDLDEVRNVG
jgi:hypothetical protein